MKTAALLALLFSIHAARADFSCTSTRRTTGGAMAAMAGGGANGVSKVYFKGQKMKTEEGDTGTLIDFDAQTITTINNARKTIAVRGFNDLAAGGQTGADVTMNAKGLSGNNLSDRPRAAPAFLLAGHAGKRVRRQDCLPHLGTGNGNVITR